MRLYEEYCTTKTPRTVSKPYWNRGRCGVLCNFYAPRSSNMLSQSRKYAANYLLTKDALMYLHPGDATRSQHKQDRWYRLILKDEHLQGHRSHQTPFHCHQRFPKHFGNHQPSPAQPHHTLDTKKWVHRFCLIVLPPCDIKTFYAVRVLYAQCIFFWL